MTRFRNMPPRGRCEWCQHDVEFFAASTGTGAAIWHTSCWNAMTEARLAYEAECDDEGPVGAELRKPARSITVQVGRISKQVA